MRIDAIQPTGLLTTGQETSPPRPRTPNRSANRKERQMEGSNIAYFRNHGVRHVWVNCNDQSCNYEAVMSLDGLPDDLVLADLKSTLRCAKCGREGVDVRPDWEILHIAEIPYEDGTIRFRYARKLSADGATRWIRDGRFCSYYPNGTLASEGTYVDDQEHGLWTEYHSNGEMA